MVVEFLNTVTSLNLQDWQWFVLVLAVVCGSIYCFVHEIANQAEKEPGNFRY